MLLWIIAVDRISPDRSSFLCNGNSPLAIRFLSTALEPRLQSLCPLIGSQRAHRQSGRGTVPGGRQGAFNERIANGRSVDEPTMPSFGDHPDCDPDRTVKTVPMADAMHAATALLLGTS